MLTRGRVRWGRAAIAAAVGSASLVFLAVPAGAGGPPPRQGGNLVTDLLSALRGGPQTPAPTRTPAQTTPRPSSAPVTAAPSTTPTTAAGGTISGTLEVGSKGSQVRTLEARLDTLHYFVGPIDETYDEDTEQAVMAFQKVHGMNRTGTLDQRTWSAISTAKDPAPLVSGGAARRVEIDIDRQVLFLYQNGKLNKILPVSTGNGEDYCENGSCGTAVTPTGDFAIYRQGTGWEYGPLGGLYNPQYFVGGYAIHGSLSVPAEPASHGCVRIPMGAAEWFPGQVSNGTPVHVR